MGRSQISSGCLAAVTLFYASVSAYAFSGTDAASFLELSPGARPAALGGSYAALATDAYAPTLNPSGLGFLRSNEFSGMHLIYVQNTSYEFASFVHPFTETNGIGVSVQYFRPGDVTGMNAAAQPTGDVGGYYAAYDLAFGQRIGNWSLGAAGKVIQAKIDDVTASAYAADAGTLFRFNEHFQFGAAVQNIGTKLTFLQQGDSLPLMERAGVAYFWSGLTATAEGSLQRGGPAALHTGLEWRNAEGYSLRGGYDTERTRQLSALSGLSVGVGLNLWGNEAAYTWVPLSDLGSSHYLTITFRFGARAHGNMEPSYDYDSENDYKLMDEMLNAK